MQGEFLKSGKFWAAIVLVLFIIAFVNTAWVAEDAFITFREAANFANGYGITWNVGERVQVFTHPLWFFLVTPIFLLKLDPFFSVLGLSFVIFVATIVLLLRLAGLPRLGSFGALALLLCSRGFIDYSSSGLENPLNHLLLVVYLTFYVFGKESRNRLHWHMLFAALLWLTRPDAFLPVFPLLIWRFIGAWRMGELRDWKWIAAAMPAILWLVFATFYFGSPIPNTALAKVATSLSAATKFHMAVEYFLWHFHNDLASVILLAAGIGLGICSRDMRLRLLAVGLILWIVYLFFIGADYMQGRFLSAVVVIAGCVVIIAAKSLPRASSLTLCMLAAIASPASAMTVAASSDYYNPKIANSGISDERGYYYPWLGLMPVLEMHGNWQTFPWFKTGEHVARTPGEYVNCAIGMFSYGAGPRITIIDPYALADAFLARLPSRKSVRPGHYERNVPYEYIESRMNGRNQIADPYWRSVYTDVNLATRAGLLNDQRFMAIVRLNLGDFSERPEFAEQPAPVGAMPDLMCPHFVNGKYEGRAYVWRLVEQQGHVVLTPAL